MKTDTQKNDDRGFLNPPRAAKYLAISRRYLGHLTAIGALPCYRLGSRCVRYKIDDLDVAMDSFKREV